MITRVFRVVARWDGREWMVRVEDEHGFHRGDTTARRLEQIESKVRAVVSETSTSGGCDEPIDLAVELQFHPEIEQRLRIAEDMCRDASLEVDGVVAGLSQLGMAAHDIDMVLRGRPLKAEPRRPLLVPNAEIAAAGLDCRPDVVAVRWEDRGHGVTTYCRECVEEDRSAWRDSPHGASAALYEGPLRCDVCDQDIEASENADQTVDGGVR